MKLISCGVLAALLLGGAARGGFQDLPRGKEETKKAPPKKVEIIAGKTLEKWIKEIASPDPSRRVDAMQKVRLFGPEKAYEAVPALLHELERHFKTPIDTSARVNALIALGSIFGQTKIDDCQPDHVKRAVKVLHRLLNDGQSIVRYRAAQGLGIIGREARSVLSDKEYADLLRTLSLKVRDFDNWETRQAAVLALGRIAFDDKKGPETNAIQALTKNPGPLTDSSFQVRISAVQILAQIGVDKQGPVQDVLLALTRNSGPLTDSSSLVRIAAIQALNQLAGFAGAATKESLVKHLEAVINRDANISVRLWAHMGIMAITDNYAAKHMAFIGKMLHHADPLVCREAASALVGLVPKTKIALDYLADGLTDKQKIIREQCAEALAALGTQTRAARQMLLEKNPKKVDPKMRKTLENFAAHTKSAVPPLIAALKDSDDEVVHWCILALGNMEQWGAPALGPLQQLAEDAKKPEPLRKMAAEAADMIRGKKKKA